MKKFFTTLATLATAALCLASGFAQAQTSPPQRLRGTIEQADGNSVTIKERRGETIKLVLAEKVNISQALAIDVSAIQPKSFIGTAAMARADGTLEALEVVVFPEEARGSGEGHYPWDLKPESTMTNATVADLVRASDGRRLTLRYKDGEKTVVVPDGVPVVTFKPGDRALLTPGAHVFIVATLVNGQPTATRVIVGRDGLVPPM